jgi:bifunctional enzyme CysN/CysC
LPRAAGAAADHLRLVVVGHVDHGKSTLIGRLLYDTGSLFDGKYEQLVAIAARRGVPFEFANVTDALQAERDQNVTIDTSQIWFRTPRRHYVLIDAPGHKEFVKNMVTGAASADAALVLIDAHEGVQEQSRRHGYLLKLLGVEQIAIVVNKMDLVGFSAEVFERVSGEYAAFLAGLGVTARVALPSLRARRATTSPARSSRMPWYTGRDRPRGAGRVHAARARRRQAAAPAGAGHLSFRPPPDRGGRGRVGHRARRRHVAVPAQREAGDGQDHRTMECAAAVLGLGRRLDRHHARHPAVRRARRNRLVPAERPDPDDGVHRARLLARAQAADGRRRYKFKLATQEFEGEIVRVAEVMDAASLEQVDGRDLTALRIDQVGKVTIRTRQPIVVDLHERVPNLGRFVIVDDLEVCGGGTIVDTGAHATALAATSANITRSVGQVTRQQRNIRNGHKGAVVWFTGLPGSGKSTLATALEQEIFKRGWQVTVLDGDNMRFGLSADLGFSAKDRAENIRRVAEVARLFAELGAIVITAFISPYRNDRLLRARSWAAKGWMCRLSRPI